MQNRRNFLRASGALMLGGLLLPGCNTQESKTSTATAAADSTATTNASQNTTAAAMPAAGLQLYTVRDLLDKDLKGTLQKIADIGYKNMESAAGAKGHYYGLKPKEFASMLDGMGMKIRSNHVLIGGQTKEEAPLPPSVQTLNNNMQQLVDMAAEAGQSYLVCAFLFPSERKTIDQYKKYAALFNKTGEACKKAGLSFAYHNHDFEFQKIDNQVPYDILLNETDKELVKMELDLYWAEKSGNDPISLFEKHSGRFPLWHVKDMDKTEKKFFTEVGNGSIDFKRIFAAAQSSGMEYYFVEQDVTPGNPIDSITTSYTNLNKVLAA
jgi:sugar phosphate isomerase/epimerase